MARQTTACLLPALAALALAPAQASTATRYQCEMVDGTQRLAVQDLSRFGAAVRGCLAVEARALPDEVPRPFATEPPSEPGLALVAAPRERPFVAAFSAPLRAVPGELHRLVAAASRTYGLDPALVAALMHVESAYQPQARSPKGALGLMQVMPATGARYGVASPRDLLDPATNIDVGARYLRDLQAMFGGRIELMLAAYNAGEGAVKRYGNRIPPYPETQEYVRKILRLYGG